MVVNLVLTTATAKDDARMDNVNATSSTAVTIAPRVSQISDCEYLDKTQARYNLEISVALKLPFLWLSLWLVAVHCILALKGLHDHE